MLRQRLAQAEQPANSFIACMRIQQGSVGLDPSLRGSLPSLRPPPDSIPLIEPIYHTG